MSLLLTTPFTSNPGHGISGNTYPEIKIVDINHGVVAERLVLFMQYGETIDDDWVGATDVDTHTVEICNFEGISDGESGWIEEPDPAYDLFISTTYPSSTSNLLYDENSTALYQLLIDKGIYAGTIQP